MAYRMIKVSDHLHVGWLSNGRFRLESKWQRDNDGDFIGFDVTAEDIRELARMLQDGDMRRSIENHPKPTSRIDIGAAK